MGYLQVRTDGGVRQPVEAGEVF
ncbi:hypothetical protein [Arthrobacter ulcerisalmonis]